MTGTELAGGTAAELVSAGAGLSGAGLAGGTTTLVSGAGLAVAVVSTGAGLSGAGAGAEECGTTVRVAVVGATGAGGMTEVEQVVVVRVWVRVRVTGVV